MFRVKEEGLLSDPCILGPCRSTLALEQASNRSFSMWLSPHRRDACSMGCVPCIAGRYVDAGITYLALRVSVTKT